MKQEEYLKKLYSNRFDHQQRKAKVALWKTLIQEFLQKYVGKDSITLDIGGAIVSLSIIFKQEKNI